MNHFCEECGTENGPEFKYCKNCGTRLVGEEKEASSVMGADGEPEMPEIALPEMAIFAGKNGKKIAFKWSKMRFFGRKISWCWPVFLLTWFFGLAGAGFWFLYRRMYRFGVALLAASLLLGTFGSLVKAGNLKGDWTDISLCFEQSINSDTGNFDEEALLTGLEKIERSENVRRLNTYSDITNLINFVAAVLLGLYALFIYERFAQEKIRSYGRPLSEVELSLAGGTSGGAAALGVILYFIVELVAITLIIMGVMLF